jgi:hypothetical protein
MIQYDMGIRVFDRLLINLGSNNIIRQKWRYQTISENNSSIKVVNGMLNVRFKTSDLIEVAKVIAQSKFNPL